MSTEANTAIARRLFEAVNGHNLALLDELLTPAVVYHNAPPGLAPGREGYQQFLQLYWAAFPDLQLTIEDQVAEGDKVVTRWTWRGTHRGEFQGIPPTGAQVTLTGMNIDRIVGGRIVERWVQFDGVGLLQQLGALATPSGATA